MAARKSVIEIALCRLALFTRRLKSKELMERVQKSHPEFIVGLRKLVDVSGDGVLDEGEIEQASRMMGLLAPVAADFVRMQSAPGLELEDPEELVARIGKMLRDPKLDRSKLEKLYPAFVGVELGKTSRIGLLVENSAQLVIEALMRYEAGEYKGAARKPASLVVHARASGER